MAAINSLRALKGVTAPEELKKGFEVQWNENVR